MSSKASYVRTRLAALGVLIVMAAGSRWPPYAGAQDSNLTLPAVNAHVNYTDQQLQDVKSAVQRNWTMINDFKAATNDHLSRIDTWEAVIDGQLVLIRYGIGILIAIFGGQLGIRWAESRRAAGARRED